MAKYKVIEERLLPIDYKSHFFENSCFIKKPITRVLIKLFPPKAELIEPIYPEIEIPDNAMVVGIDSELIDSKQSYVRILKLIYLLPAQEGKKE